MPAHTQGQWNSLADSLKNFITHGELKVEEKNKTPFHVKNTLSTMISTNNNSLKLEIDDRRFFIADVSHDRVGDFEYFDKLGSYTTDDAVGEAFYWYCKKHAEENNDFDPRRIPKTQSKTDQVIDNLWPIHKFIKARYVLRRRGINK